MFAPSFKGAPSPPSPCQTWHGSCAAPPWSPLHFRRARLGTAHALRAPWSPLPARACGLTPAFSRVRGVWLARWLADSTCGVMVYLALAAWARFRLTRA